MTSGVRAFSVVLPAYNEEENIGPAVEAVLAYARARGLAVEVLVVDDGSTDATAARVEELRRRVPEVRLLRHAQNLGYGEALRTGFSAAQSDWIFLTDSDRQFDLGELDGFREAAADADLVLGYRRNRADSKVRAAFTALYTRVVRLLFGLRLRDVGCAFKLFRRTAWTAVPPVRSRDHKVFTVEWLLRASRGGFRMVERPVTHYPRPAGRATGARLDLMVGTGRALVDLWRREFSKPLRAGADADRYSPRSRPPAPPRA